jgi:hypothetical protein
VEISFLNLVHKVSGYVMLKGLDDKHIEGALLPVACGGPQCQRAVAEIIGLRSMKNF